MNQNENAIRCNAITFLCIFLRYASPQHKPLWLSVHSIQFHYCVAVATTKSYRAQLNNIYCRQRFCLRFYDVFHGLNASASSMHLIVRSFSAKSENISVFFIATFAFCLIWIEFASHRTSIWFFWLNNLSVACGWREPMRFPPFYCEVAAPCSCVNPLEMRIYFGVKQQFRANKIIGFY